MKNSIMFIFVLTILSSKLFAQNYLLESSKSASFVTGQIGEEKGAFYTQATAGYSINGRFDISLTASHKNENGYLAFNAISPGLSYLIIKQNKMPFSLGASFDYEFKTFPINKYLTHSTMRPGLSLFHKLRISNKISFVPGIYGKRNFIRYSLEPHHGNLRLNTLGVQNTILLKKISITPSVSYTEKKGCLLTLQVGFFLFKRDYIESVYR